MTQGYFDGPWESLQAYWSEDKRTQENSARPADVLLFFDTVGTYGEIAHPKVMDFETSFIQEPAVTYGYRVDEEEGDELVDGQWPRCYGFVREYEMTPQGLYTGAYLVVAVDIPLLAEMPEYNIHHYFRLQGIAMKDIPAEEEEGR